jgi:hypothetical protein
MQAARLSYATNTRFTAIFLDAVAGKSPLKQSAKENLLVRVFDASPGRMDLSYGFFSRRNRNIDVSYGCASAAASECSQGKTRSQSGVNRHGRSCGRLDGAASDPLRKRKTAALPERGRKSIRAQWTCIRHRFWIDTAPGFAPKLQQGRYTRRLRPSGMVNVSIRSTPRHWRSGRQGRPRSFPFADEEVFSCAISAMRK